MRVVMLVLALATAAGALASCAGTSDPWDPAIQAMSGVNSCGSGGTDDINQCRGHPRSSN